MRLLALDIGTVRTGIAYLDEEVGVPLPLTTLIHKSPEQLLLQLKTLSADRKIDRLLIGLPLLPSGEEGEQAATVRRYAEHLTTLGLPIKFLDERYSSAIAHPRKKQPKTGKARTGGGRAKLQLTDDNAVAAHHLLLKFLGC